MENAGVDEVTAMEKDASKPWFTSLTAGAIVGLDKIILLIALIVFRVGWWSTIYCQQILLGMLTIFGPIQWAFSLLPKWEGAWAKWLIRYLTVRKANPHISSIERPESTILFFLACFSLEEKYAVFSSRRLLLNFSGLRFTSITSRTFSFRCRATISSSACW